MEKINMNDESFTNKNYILRCKIIFLITRPFYMFLYRIKAFHSI